MSYNKGNKVAEKKKKNSLKVGRKVGKPSNNEEKAKLRFTQVVFILAVFGATWLATTLIFAIVKKLHIM